MDELNDPRDERTIREDEIAKGERARRLLEDDLLQACLEAIISHHDRAWKNSEPDDNEAREHHYRMLRSAADFKGLLTTLVRTGELSAEQLALALAQEEAERAENEHV